MVRTRSASYFAVLVAVAMPIRAQSASFELASAAPGGQAGDAASSAHSISRNGRYVAFLSDATDLVPGDTNGCEDVFVRDRATGTTRRASVATGGGEQHVLLLPTVPAWREPTRPFVSDDGDVVVFASTAPDLAPGDSGLYLDVYAHVFSTGTTTRISTRPDGAEGTGDSGALMLALCYGGTCPPLYYANGIDMSPDGRFVAFTSGAPDLAPGDTNGVFDVLLHDRLTGTTELVSRTTSGVAGNAASYNPVISDDGRTVAFVSDATAFVPNDTNLVPDVFVHDRVLRTTVCASVLGSGSPGGGGSLYYSVHIPHCWPCGGTGFQSQRIAISSAGGHVAFAAASTSFGPGPGTQHRGAYVRDLATDALVLASAAPFGQPPQNGYAQVVDFAADGRFLAFLTNSTGIVASDTTSDLDVLIRDFALSATVLATPEVPTWSEMANADVAEDGHQLAIATTAALVAADQQAVSDVYARGTPAPPFVVSCDGASIPCPCGPGAVGAGCANSADGNGARLTATGRADASADTVVLTCERLPAGGVLVFVAGTSTAAPTPFGDGVLCVGGSLVRFGLRSAPIGTATFGGPLDPRLSTVLGAPPAGAVRHVQCWYRNAATYCTSATWNLTNALRIEWI